MSAPTRFYTAQAEACAKAAGETDLPRLREKYQRAGAAWQTLANREHEIAQARERRIAENALKAAASETGASEAGASEIGASEIGASEIGASEIGASEIGASLAETSAAE